MLGVEWSCIGVLGVERSCICVLGVERSCIGVLGVERSCICMLGVERSCICVLGVSNLSISTILYRIMNYSVSVVFFVFHIICRRAHVLFLRSLHIVVSNTYCVVFLFCFSSSCVPYVASSSGLSIFDCP